jgi:hypothetical protein
MKKLNNKGRIKVPQTTQYQNRNTHQCTDGLNGGVDVNDALVDTHLVAVKSVRSLRT